MNIKTIFKSRWVLGTICLIIAVALIFAYTSSINANNEYIQIVTVTRPIQKGDVIPKESLATVEVGMLNIPEDYAKSVSDITGKYAQADFAVGDFILLEKVSETMKSIDLQLSNLDGSKVAVSITIKDFAKGMSDKIVSGDIVSCFVVTDKEAFLPQELNYVEVITTTTIDGSDKIRPEDSTEQNLATVTLLVSPEQAKLLTNYNQNADVHLALAYRGEDENKQQFLHVQEEILLKLLTNEPESEGSKDE